MPSSRSSLSSGALVRPPVEELKGDREEALRASLSKESQEGFLESYTEVFDHYFRKALQESLTGQRLFSRGIPFALIAVGGYGRKELCIHSDIDVLILFEKRIPTLAKNLVEDILYPLWDLGLELGYGTRTIKDCVSLSRSDFEVLTSMIEARFICGDSLLYFSLKDKLRKSVVQKKAMAFVRWLEEKNELRMQAYGDASSLLEPNLKEGIGGLRDYHHTLWVAGAFLDLRAPRDLEYAGLFSHREYEDLRGHLNFIWLVRNHLHHLSGRCTDRLGFEYQEEIAQRLGYKHRKGYLAVEQFMGDTHAHMSGIKSLHRSFMTTHIPGKRSPRKRMEIPPLPHDFELDHDEMRFSSATVIPSRPAILMEAFTYGGRYGLHLTLEARRLIKDFLYLVDDGFRRSPEAVSRFVTILKGDHAFKTLEEMFETGFLEAFIPEFKQVRDRVQFDTYHIYPVARHLLETVKNLKELAREKDFILLDIFSDVRSKEALLLGALLHDIGKVGSGHAKRGVVIARKILTRLGLQDPVRADILFLIGHHLLLAETATRRDLNDEKIVVQFARTVGTVERLKMLYLLTWADSKATGPRAWTDWTANLVQELFLKALHILTTGELATPDVSRKVKQTTAIVTRELATVVPSEDLDALFDAMSPRYLLNTKSREIVSHIGVVRQLQKEFEVHPLVTFSLEARRSDAEVGWDITFIAKDRPGLFCDITGVLAMNSINILSANIYTWRDGTAVDVFTVTSPLDEIHAEETWSKVRRELKSALTGDLSLAHRLAQKSAPSVLSADHRPQRPPKVVVDNSASDFSTLIEVFANDRVGLLYVISKALFDLGLDIRVARIGTKADQVADVFYVRDVEGQKVEDPRQVEEIKSTLMNRLTKP